MKKKFVMVLVLIVLLIIIIAVVFVSYPKLQESRIKAEINSANYCEIDSDCIDAGSKCPFGCYAYVNKNEVARIFEMINSFDSKCVYSCLACPIAICEDKKCKEVCE